MREISCSKPVRVLQALAGFCMLLMPWPGKARGKPCILG